MFWLTVDGRRDWSAAMVSTTLVAYVERLRSEEAEVKGGVGGIVGGESWTRLGFEAPRGIP